MEAVPLQRLEVMLLTGHSDGGVRAHTLRLAPDRCARCPLPRCLRNPGASPYSAADASEWCSGQYPGQQSQRYLKDTPGGNYQDGG